MNKNREKHTNVFLNIYTGNFLLNLIKNNIKILLREKRKKVKLHKLRSNS